MSSYGQYAITGAKTLNSVRPTRRVRKATKMKLTLKQRFRNWLNRDDEDTADVPQLAVETSSLSSEGMRLQVYRASGGYVIETRSYDHHKDRHHCTMHVITEDEDLGQRMGQIITMEALRG
jgi:hypothetical protein